MLLHEGACEGVNLLDVEHPRGDLNLDPLQVRAYALGGGLRLGEKRHEAPGPGRQAAAIVIVFAVPGVLLVRWVGMEQRQEHRVVDFNSVRH